MWPGVAAERCLLLCHHHIMVKIQVLSDSCNKDLGGKCTEVKSHYRLTNTQRVEVQLYKRKRQRWGLKSATWTRVTHRNMRLVWDLRFGTSFASSCSQMMTYASATTQLKTTPHHPLWLWRLQAQTKDCCLQNQDKVKLYQAPETNQLSQLWKLMLASMTS